MRGRESHGLFLGFLSFCCSLALQPRARHPFSCLALVHRSHHLHRALPRMASLSSSAGYSGNNRICHCQSKFERKRSADLTVRPEIKYSHKEYFPALLVPPIVVLIHQATEHIHKNGHNSRKGKALISTPLNHPDAVCKPEDRQYFFKLTLILVVCYISK